MRRFYARYLAFMFLGAPAAFAVVIAAVMLSGATGALSALIGLAGGVALLLASAWISYPVRHDVGPDLDPVGDPAAHRALDDALLQLDPRPALQAVDRVGRPVGEGVPLDRPGHRATP